MKHDVGQSFGIYFIICHRWSFFIDQSSQRFRTKTHRPADASRFDLAFGDQPVEVAHADMQQLCAFGQADCKRSVKTPGQAAARSRSAGFQCQGSKSAIWRAG